MIGKKNVFRKNTCKLQISIDTDPHPLLIQISPATGEFSSEGKQIGEMLSVNIISSVVCRSATSLSKIGLL